MYGQPRTHSGLFREPPIASGEFGRIGLDLAGRKKGMAKGEMRGPDPTVMVARSADVSQQADWSWASKASRDQKGRAKMRVQAATRTFTDIGGSRRAEGKPGRSRPLGPWGSPCGIVRRASWRSPKSHRFLAKVPFPLVIGWFRSGRRNTPEPTARFGPKPISFWAKLATLVRAPSLRQRSYTGHSPLWIVASDDWQKGDAMARNAGATASEHHRFRDIPGPWKTGHGKLGSLGFGVLLSHLRSAPNG
jgi:hypothetical protein